MKIARIPLKPHSRFHFGELKLDHDLALSDTSLFAHSDTLFSALVNAYSSYADGAEGFIDKFKNDEEIRVSSVFYYLQNGSHRVYFLPKPVFLDINSPKADDGKHKKRNRIKFVSQGTWKNGFEMEQWFDEPDKNIVPNYHVIQDTFVMTKTEFEGLGSNLDSIAKITLNPKSPKRATEDAAIYYQADIETGSSETVIIGLYFLYEAEGQAETDLKIATNIMAYTGIGGEIKNTGRTIKSKPEFDSLDFELSVPNPKYVNVALFNPLDQEAFDQVIYYSTSLRGGRLLGASEGFSMVVRMIEEGALVQSADLKGRLIDLGPDEHDRPIYRYGIPFLIPVKYDN